MTDSHYSELETRLRNTLRSKAEQAASACQADLAVLPRPADRPHTARTVGAAAVLLSAAAIVLLLAFNTAKPSKPETEPTSELALPETTPPQSDTRTEQAVSAFDQPGRHQSCNELSAGLGRGNPETCPTQQQADRDGAAPRTAAAGSTYGPPSSARLGARVRFE